MPNVTQLSVYSDDAGSVDQVDFDPISASPGRCEFTAQVTDSSVGWMRLILTFSPASRNRKTTRITGRLSIPVVRTKVIDGVSVEVSEDTILHNWESVVPQVATSAERTVATNIARRLMDLPEIQNYTENLAPMY
jgi:hypothetical protein